MKTIILIFLLIGSFVFPCEIQNHFEFRVVNSEDNILYWGCYDAINLGPHRVEYHLSAYMVNYSSGGRPSVTFTLDRDGGYLRRLLRENGFDLPTHASFTNSGFDRGHMAPNEDFNNTEENARLTFFIGNVWPQTPALNRGQWAQIESYTRSLAIQNEQVHVIIIVDQFHNRRLSNGVAIPRAFIRQVYTMDGQQLLNVVAYQ